MGYDTGFLYIVEHDEKNNKFNITVKKAIENIENIVKKEIDKNFKNKDSKIIDISNLTKNNQNNQTPEEKLYFFSMKYALKKDLYKLVSNDSLVIKGNKYTMNDPDGRLLGFITTYTDRPIIVINEDLVRNIEDFFRILYHEQMHRFIRDEILDRKITATEDPGKIIYTNKHAA